MGAGDQQVSPQQPERAEAARAVRVPRREVGRESSIDRFLLVAFALGASGCGGSGSEPARPPGQDQIAYVQDNGNGAHDIYLVNPDGSGTKQLTRRTYLNDGPEWSPDGARIAFASNRGDYFSNLFLMRVDGSHQVQLTREPNGAGSHAWSPDGTRLAYTAYDVGKEEVAVVLADGSGLTRLTPGRAPAWSPDGRWLAFESDRTGSYDVFLMTSDGHALRQLSHSRPNGEKYGWAGTPAWSPNGKLIALEAYRFGNYEIAVMDTAGGQEHRITSDSVDDRGPRWSPDGAWIAFLRGHDNSGDPRWELWVMKPDGSDQVRLTSGRCDGYLGFSWSPDARQLAFARGCRGESAEGVWIVGVDGSGLRQLVGAQTYAPQWSRR